MAVEDITTIKSYFETGDTPTQGQFENLIDTLNASLPVDYRVVACVLRNTGSGWFALDDVDHAPINVDSVSNDTNSITIDYTGIGATEVVSLVVTPDETYSKYYTFGSSVGIASANIRITSLNRTGQALVTHSGNGNFTVSNSSGSEFTGLSIDSYNPTNGRLTINHDRAEGIPRFWEDGNTRVTNANNSFSYTKMVLKLLNNDGTQQTLANPEVARFWVEREIAIKKLVDPNDVSESFGNIWVIGIFKVT